jgi:hypothetical protein
MNDALNPHDNPWGQRHREHSMALCFANEPHIRALADLLGDDILDGRRPSARTGRGHARQFARGAAGRHGHPRNRFSARCRRWMPGVLLVARWNFEQLRR